MPTADEILRQIQQKNQMQTDQSTTDLQAIKKTRIKTFEDMPDPLIPEKGTKLTASQAFQLAQKDLLFDKITGEPNYIATAETLDIFTQARQNKQLGGIAKGMGKNLTRALVNVHKGVPLAVFNPSGAAQQPRVYNNPKWVDQLDKNLGEPSPMQDPSKRTYDTKYEDIGNSMGNFLSFGLGNYPLNVKDKDPAKLAELEQQIGLEAGLMMFGVGLLKLGWKGLQYGFKFSKKTFSSLQRVATASGNTADKRLAKTAGDELADKLGGSIDDVVDNKETRDIIMQPFETKNYSNIIDVRPLEDVAKEVITNNPNGKWNKLAHSVLNPMKYINPSRLNDSPIAKGLVAFSRQRIATEELAKVIKAKFFNKHIKDWTTNGWDDVLPIDKDGFFGTTGKQWMDVFENPAAYKLTDKQKVFIDDYKKAIDEVGELMREHGIKIPEGTYNNPWGQAMYIPRRATGVITDGDEFGFDKVSQPLMERIYKTATEGYEAGVRYMSDPGAVLEDYVRASYNEIIEKQFESYIKKYALTPTSLMKKLAFKEWDNLDKAQNKLKEARKTYEQTRKRIPRNTPQAQKDGLLDARRIAKKNLANAEKNHKDARKVYNNKSARVKSRSQVRANIFDYMNNADVIDMNVWRNKYLPQKDIDLLAKYFKNTNSLKPRGPNYFSKTLARSTDIVRTVAANLDFGGPFIQGLPVLFTNPKRWHRATVQHFRAFANPKVNAADISKNFDVYADMAKHGLPPGDTEFFEILNKTEFSFDDASRLKQSIKLFEKLDKLNITGLGKFVTSNTFGRSQAAYGGFLMRARRELWESMLPTWTDSKAELATYIRNLTGGLDSRALGVGPDARAAESAWMAFSPRLLRSTIALMSDSLAGVVNFSRDASNKGVNVALDHFNKDPRAYTKKLTARQAASMKSMGRLVSGVHAVYISTGLALGKSQEEIEAGLNPLNGKRYLSHEINGDYIGVGGQVRAFIQLGAKITGNLYENTRAISEGNTPVTEETWKNVTGEFIKDITVNPLLQFYLSRGAVGYNIFGGVVEGLSGGQIDAMPYERIDNLPDVIKHVGTSALPFSVQGAMEGESATATFAGVMGLRSSAGTVIDEQKILRNHVAQEIYGKNYEYLDMDQKSIVNNDESIEIVKPLVDEYRATLGGNYNAYLTESTEIMNKRLEDILQIDQWFQNGTNDKGEVFNGAMYRSQRSKIYGEWSDSKENLDGQDKYREVQEDDIFKEISGFDKIADEYIREIVLHDYFDPASREFDYKRREEDINDFREKYGEETFERIETWLGQNRSDLERELVADRETLLPYFKLTEEKVEEVGAKYGFTMKDVIQWQRLDKVGKLYKLKEDRQKWSYVNSFISKMSQVKENYRKANPDIDVLLNKWDYVSTPVTQEALDFEINRKNNIKPSIANQDIRIQP